MRSEFAFIDYVKNKYSLTRAGDDCAVIPQDAANDLLITADMLVENEDFRLDWSTPEQIGHKALAVSLSDIAAMGGNPTQALISIAIVENLWKGDFLERFYDGWHALAAKFGVELVGGDISRTSGPLTIDSTVLGASPAGRAILRSGARVGDKIFVTGDLGTSAGGLEILRTGGAKQSKGAEEIVRHHLEPLPHLNAAKYLQTKGLAHAMIDVSDGLSSDLGHICRASGVGAEVDVARIPVDPHVLELFGCEMALGFALNGGEDLSLLFTADTEENIPGATLIGNITGCSGVVDLIVDGKRTPLEAGGFRHF